MRQETNDGLLKVRTEQHPEGWLVEVSGELDLSNIGTLDTELQRLNGDVTVLLDLTHLDFMDSAGIALLARAADITTVGLSLACDPQRLRSG